MSALVFNVAKGMVNAYHDRVVTNDPSTSALIIVLLKTWPGTTDQLQDCATLQAVFDAGGVEADFTGYARKTLTDLDLTSTTVDNSANTRNADIPDQTWNPAGGATNNTIAKVLVCYDGNTGSGTDTNIVPLTAHDWVITTNGGGITAQIPASGYFLAA